VLVSTQKRQREEWIVKSRFDLRRKHPRRDSRSAGRQMAPFEDDDPGPIQGMVVGFLAATDPPANVGQVVRG
jgi:hypothetical protein